MTRCTPKTRPTQALHTAAPDGSGRLPRDTALLLQVLALGQREEAEGLLTPVQGVVERLRKKRAAPMRGQVAEGLRRTT